MEQVRDSILIHCCEDIASARIAMGLARSDEQSAIARAMKRLQAKPHDAHQYRHGGVELALVEGVDKLRVRLTKEAEDTSSVDHEEAEEPEAEESGAEGEEAEG